MTVDGGRGGSDNLPSYDELPIAPEYPPESSWGLWGEQDVFGCLNLLSAERVRAATAGIRTGTSFPLNWDMELPDPPMFGRSRFRHRVYWVGRDAGHDEELDGWNTQSSSQWDGFRHVRHARYGFYGGVPDEEHGVHHWAVRGIVGRCILVDVGRYRNAVGRPLVMNGPDVIEAEEIGEALVFQATTVEVGDVLLMRTGWIGWYRSLEPAQRRSIGEASPGLRPGRRTARVLWDLHIAAIAADNPAVELTPTGVVATPEQRAAARSDAHEQIEISAHRSLLPLLGLPLGELFDLERLAEACAEDGHYEGFFVSAPLNLRGGVASPPNAIVIR
jgi:hypothetical protein